MGVEKFTQTDIDALLGGLADEDMAEIAGDAESGEAPESSPAERFPRLEIICDRFAGHATAGLSDLFRTRVELNPIRIDIRSFGEIMRSFPVPSAMSAIRTNGVFAGDIVSVIDSRLLFALVETAFGNFASSRPRIEGREFTPAEQGVARLANERMLDAMGTAWREAIANVSFSEGRFEMNPRFACVAPPAEPCLEIFFEAELDVSLGSVFWIIPLSAISRFRGFLSEYPDGKRIITCPDGEFVNFLERLEKERSRKETPVDPDGRWLDFANNIPVPRLAQFLRNEHPQTLACVFAHLSPQVAARNLLAFPAGVRAGIVTRMERLNVRNPVFLQLLDEVVSRLNSAPEALILGRGKRLLAALSDISPETRAEIEDEIREETPRFFNDDY